MFKQQGNGDLGDCLYRILGDGGPPAQPPVTLLEIDQLLQGIAQTCRFSGPQIRNVDSNDDSIQKTLQHVLHRLQPAEAKWLIRLLLKDLSPLHLNEYWILGSVHFLLPDLLRFQQDFSVAVETLKSTAFVKYPSSPDPHSAVLLRKLVSGSYRPQVGVKVSRSHFVKARSIDQCMKITNGQRWMIEKKYDGEYCEIHIDLCNGQDWLKIFSKSAKDSTNDRMALRSNIAKSLGIQTPCCRIKSRCILLGEMVVYNDEQKRIMPFHKIRRYVTRSGMYLGINQDSPRVQHEHLMIVFFDMLLLDDLNVMQKSIEERKALLQKICRTRTGRVMISESKVLDFSLSDAKKKLMSHFAASIAARQEGLLLKPCGRPYLSIGGINPDHTSSMIKVKKDYINGLGDEADFVVVGASYNAQCALATTGLSRTFTHFHLGCLTNVEQAKRFHARPNFKFVGTLTADGCIPPKVIQRANQLAKSFAEPFHKSQAPSQFDFDIEPPHMDVTFVQPFVFEVLGSSFDKPSNCDYWMLRHPRVKKLHEDRTWKDCIDFQELQNMAYQATSHPVDSESQENLLWMSKIERSCRRKIARASCQTTPVSRANKSPAKGSIISPQVRTTTLQDINNRDESCNTDSLPTPPPSSENENDNPPSRKRKLSDAFSPIRKSTMSSSVPVTHSPLADITSRLNSSMSATPSPVRVTFKDTSSAVEQRQNPSPQTQHIERSFFTCLLQIAYNATPDLKIDLDHEPIRGECRLISQATHGTFTKCPLTNSIVYMSLSEDATSLVNAARITRMAKMHGATVMTNFEKWLEYKTIDKYRRVYHIDKSGGEILETRITKILERIVSTQAQKYHGTLKDVLDVQDMNVDVLDLNYFDDVCSSYASRQDKSNNDALLNKMYEKNILGNIIYDKFNQQTRIVIKWPV